MGVLRARIAGQWVDIGGGTPAAMQGVANLPGVVVPIATTQWGPNVTVPVPLGATGVTIAASLTSYANNYTAGSGQLQLRLDLSTDNGATWQQGPTYETGPVGQTGSPVMNRTTIAVAYTWTIPVVTATVLLRAMIADPSRGTPSTSTTWGTFMWWISGGALPGLAVPVSPSQPLGIIAVGQPTTGTVNPFVCPVAPAISQITNTLPVYFAVGRRYRVVHNIRAATTPTAGSFRLFMRDGTTNFATQDRWPWVTVGNYTDFTHEFMFDGDGTTRQLNIAIDNVTYAYQIWLDNSPWYVEDMGSSQSPALPLVTSPLAPAGLLGVTQCTGTAWTNATAVGSDITATAGRPPSLTLALNPARLYRAVFIAKPNSSVDGDVALWRFVENGVDRYGWTQRMQANTNALAAEWIFQPAAAGAIVYKVQGSRNAGTGTISLGNASAQSPITFYIEDLGGAVLP